MTDEQWRLVQKGLQVVCEVFWMNKNNTDAFEDHILGFAYINFLQKWVYIEKNNTYALTISCFLGDNNWR